MKLHQLDLNLLLALDALMTQGSVTRAAESLFISQPAMSHSLGRLRAFRRPAAGAHAPGMLPTPGPSACIWGAAGAAAAGAATLGGGRVRAAPVEAPLRALHHGLRGVRADPALIQRLRKLAPGVTIEIRILRDTLPKPELASGEIRSRAGV